MACGGGFMNDVITQRLRALLGAAAVERDPIGRPRAIPESEESGALVCPAAQAEGWKMRVEGRPPWLPPDAPADFALSPRGLDRVISISPADLVATVQAGVPLDALRRQLADQGMWLGVD